MKLELFQVDAFADHVFAGNPAAVCPLGSWLSDELMQQIAAENNLSETAFFVRRDGVFEIRWFTPTTEVELCGHATLASAFVIWEFIGGPDPVVFETRRSGRLMVGRSEDRIVLDFPARSLAEPSRVPEALSAGLGLTLQRVLTSGENSGFYVALCTDEATVRRLDPDMRALSTLGEMGVVATAPGETCDFVSRCFAPTFGIPEDPVTGSIHCFLAPYWAGRLGKTVLLARQVSNRGGELTCEVRDDRVLIGGRASCYLVGSIEVPDEKGRPPG